MAQNGVAAQAGITVHNLASHIGASIDADPEALLSGAHAKKINAVLEQRGVVVLPEVNLTDAQQVAFTETLGVFAREAGSADGIFKVTLDTRVAAHAPYVKTAFFWHIDGTMNDIPIRASIMSARRVSASGGQTEFSNTYAAYEDLPAADKAKLETLKAVHSFEAIQRHICPEPTYAELMDWRRHNTKTLPLVWTHKSGRKSLVVGSTAHYVEGLSPEDSSELLTRLRDFATQPRFVYRHEWKVGDMVIWDNTGTMHRALHYAPDSGRLMHRTKLQGEEAFA